MAVDLSSLWNHSDPAASEQRFRAALATAEGDDAVILRTQIARTHGLRGDFAQARRLLDEIREAMGTASPEAQVRFHLELGRTHASPAHPPETRTAEAREAARAAYTAAFERARDGSLDALAIDALHMMVMVDPAPDEQLAWNLKAVALMEASSQPEAKKWEGSLRNNIGYAHHLAGRYDEALVQYRLSLAAHERAGRPASVRIARWMIASTLRARGDLQQALEIQHALEREWDEAGAPDPYVYEELEHLYRATGDTAAADRYAAKLAAARPPA
jgi:tetratricopeptide (TPR) repeat protein